MTMLMMVMMMMMVKVEDAVRAISNVDDYAGSAKALAATTLRFYGGGHHLDDHTEGDGYDDQNCRIRFYGYNEI